MIKLIQAMTFDELVEWYEYAQPIVSACSGFTKTNGHMLWEADGTFTAMSNDRSWLYIVTGLRPSPVTMCCSIIKFTGAKNDLMNLINRTTELGDNLVYREMLNLKNAYMGYVYNPLPIYEQDMTQLAGFEDALNRKASEAIPSIKFCDKFGRNMIFASKSITPINKGDTAYLQIYNDISNCDDVFVFKQVVHKKKYNVDINIISRQIRVTN